jgi:ribokinase
MNVELLVAGPITRDLTLLVDGIPDAGGSVAARASRVAAGGKGGTPARVAARLGARVRLLGAVGTDAAGDEVLAELAAAGIDVAGVERLAGATDQIVHVVSPDGSRRYFEDPGANASVGALDVPDGATALLSTALPRAAVESVAAARLIVDAAGPPDVTRAVLGRADVVRADAEEAAGLVDAPVTDWESATEAGRLLLDTGPWLAIVQAPGMGDVVVSHDRVLRLPLLDVEVVDPTGAGDAFIATLTVLLMRGVSVDAAAREASAAAAGATARLGALS